LPDAHTELVNVFAEGSRVAAEHVGRGMHSGPFVTASGTIPPTGRSVELSFAELFALRDGKITRLHAYYDSATMMRQLGLAHCQVPPTFSDIAQTRSGQTNPISPHDCMVSGVTSL
jgi:hypothetical protein